MGALGCRQRTVVLAWTIRLIGRAGGVHFGRLLVGLVSMAGILLAGAGGSLAAKEKKEKGERWALLVGIDDYAYARDLDYCVADQTALQKELVAAGFDPRQVVLMSDGEKDRRYEPTYANLREQIKLTCNCAEPGDLVLISFSGHGVLIGKTSYLCPIDARLDDRETLISLEWVYEQLQQCKANLKLVMIDACRNVPPELGGKWSPGSREFKESTDEFIRGSHQQLPEGIVLLNSCSKGGFAQEDQKLGHGVFTYFLLEGLRGKADRDSDRQVTLGELIKFVSLETKLYVGEKFSELQRPMLKGDLTGEALDYPLASVSGVRQETSPVVPKQTPTGSTADVPRLVAPFPESKAKVAQTATANRLGRKVVEQNSLGMSLTLIPAGEFQMGSPTGEAGRNADETQHRVRITRPFYLGTHEVTKGQFRKFAEATGYKTEAETDGNGGFGYTGNDKTESFKQDAKYTWRNWGVDQSEESPVVNVSWNDASAFCAWLSRKEGARYRLPSEAEWEYACRGGNGEPVFLWGRSGTIDERGERGGRDGQGAVEFVANGQFIRRLRVHVPGGSVQTECVWRV